MVEINNQRKAFLDMLAWSEELITDVRKPKSWLWRHCKRRAIFDYSDHPHKLVTLNPKLKSTGAGRYQLLSRWWDAYRKQLGLKNFSPKSRDAVATQQIKERGALPMIIVVISVRQSTVAAYGLHCRALVMVSSGIKGWQPDCKIQRSGRNGQRLMYEQSHRDYLRSGYLHHRLPVMGC